MGVWIKRLGVVALLGFPLAVLGTRMGLYDFRGGFAILQVTLLLSITVFVLGVIIGFVHRHSNKASAKAALMGVVLSLIPLAILGNQIRIAKSVPYSHHVSTDVINPPAFNKIVALRGADANPLAYDASVLAEQQQNAYPKVTTLATSESVTQAYQKALTIAQEMGWEIVHQDSEAGMIEATETTWLWQFKDDIVIRIADQNGRTAIDLRSISRVGDSDLGANAQRIEAFLERYQAQ